MKFAVSTKTRLGQYKVNSDKLRTTPKGAKVMSLKKLDKLDKKAKADKNVVIYEHTDPEFIKLMQGGN